MHLSTSAPIPCTYLGAADVLFPAQQDTPVRVRQEAHERSRSGRQISQRACEPVLERLERRLPRADEDHARFGRDVLRLVAVVNRTLQVHTSGTVFLTHSAIGT